MDFEQWYEKAKSELVPDDFNLDWMVDPESFPRFAKRLAKAAWEAGNSQEEEKA